MSDLYGRGFGEEYIKYDFKTDDLRVTVATNSDRIFWGKGYTLWKPWAPISYLNMVYIIDIAICTQNILLVQGGALCLIFSDKHM